MPNLLENTFFRRNE